MKWRRAYSAGHLVRWQAVIAARKLPGYLAVDAPPAINA
jgi:hypothetical protein